LEIFLQNLWQDAGIAAMLYGAQLTFFQKIVKFCCAAPECSAHILHGQGSFLHGYFSFYAVERKAALAATGTG
jgi:hypothetical protein